MGPAVVNVSLSPSNRISACKNRPTSKGSGAYTDFIAPGVGKS